MKNENQTTAAKQEYQAPLLSEFGNVADLTFNANTTQVDAVNTSQ